MRFPVALVRICLLFALVALPTSVEAKRPANVNFMKLRVVGHAVRAPLATSPGEAELTLDPELQKAMEKLLETSRAPEAAIVMSDVRTGRILAWASRGSSADLVRTPRFPGASIYKVVTAGALLDGEHVFRGTSQCYSGGSKRLQLIDVQSLCRPGEPRVKFGRALGLSINVVFGRLAVAHLESERLEKVAARLGIGSPVPIDVPVGLSQIDVPDDALGKARAAAGFSRSGVSPLSVLFMMQTIANGGERVRMQVRGSADRVKRRTEGRALKESTANALVKMLEVTTSTGTSRKAFRDRKGRPNVRAAGKTGTLIAGKPARMVSWFAGFAPSRKPEVAVAVMLANDLKWWRKGNEVARDALDAYFRLRAQRGSAKSPR